MGGGKVGIQLNDGCLAKAAQEELCLSLHLAVSVAGSRHGQPLDFMVHPSCVGFSFLGAQILERVWARARL